MTHHNHPEYTDLALKSLLANSSYEGRQHVVVIDDGSDVGYVPTNEVLDKIDAMRGSVGELPYFPNNRSGLTLFRNEHAAGWIGAANIILRAFLEFAGYDDAPEYLVITNNDVVFLPDWDKHLVDCFEANEDCGMAGPVTNQPGHQPLQLVDSHPVPADDMGLFIACRERYIKAQAEQGVDLQVQRVPFVNGFCFMLKRDRLVVCESDEPVLFEGIDGHLHYGGEDLYQFRMREKGLFASYIVAGSWVYHFKDVSMDTAKLGRMGMDPAKLPRLGKKNGGEASEETSPDRDSTVEVEGPPDPPQEM